MTVRELNPEEFHKLEGHPSLNGFLLPSPDVAKVIVAEDKDQIVGYWFAINTVHLEPVWIHEKYRGGLLIGRMWNKLKELLDRYHVNKALSCAGDPIIEDYLTRLGFEKLPYSTYVFAKDT